jgi:predicted transcriptional regulator
MHSNGAYITLTTRCPKGQNPPQKGDGEMAEVARKGRTHRVNVNFSEGAYKDLAQIAEKRQKNVSDVVREAIAFEKWYQDTVDSGGQVLVERDNGRVQEVVRP